MSASPIWTAPNILSLARLAGAAALGPTLAAGPGAAAWAGLALFVALAGTDWLDGWLARRTGRVSRLGAALDPVADKALCVCALLGLAAAAPFGGALWFQAAAALIVLREFLVAGLRSAVGAAALKVTRAAKWKAAAQMLALGALIAAAAAAPTAPGPAAVLGWIGAPLLWLAAAATAWTGLAYARQALALLGETCDEEKPQRAAAPADRRPRAPTPAE